MFPPEIWAQIYDLLPNIKTCVRLSRANKLLCELWREIGPKIVKYYKNRVETTEFCITRASISKCETEEYIIFDWPSAWVMTATWPVVLQKNSKKPVIIKIITNCMIKHFVSNLCCWIGVDGPVYLDKNNKIKNFAKACKKCKGQSSSARINSYQKLISKIIENIAISKTIRDELEWMKKILDKARFLAPKLTYT